MLHVRVKMRCLSVLLYTAHFCTPCMYVFRVGKYCDIFENIENIRFFQYFFIFFDIFDFFRYIYRAFARTLLKLYEIDYQIIVCVCVCVCIAY